MAQEWIGFDLDGTLAVYDVWRGYEHIGKPIPAMINKVKELLAAGVKVKIFTARACLDQPEEDRAKAIQYIQDWSVEQFGQKLEVTSEKDWFLIEYYDDRAIGVDYNTGKIKGED